MRDRIYRTEALVLRRNDLKEADRVLVLATPGGKRRVVARGARKTTSRLAGHIELFTHATMLLAVGRNLDIVTQSQVIQRFAHLHTDLMRLSWAYYIAELYDVFTQDDEPNDTLFHILVQTFAALNATAQPELLLRAYELRLLSNTGYRPQLHHCAICQAELTEQADRFSPTLGGVLCPRDVHADRNALPMRIAPFKLLRYLQRHPYDVIDHMHISQEVLAETEYLLRTYIARILERNLKSLPFLESLHQQSRALPASNDL